MDLNQLLHAHQVSVMKANAAGDRVGRDRHFEKVAEYARRIRELRDLTRPIATPAPPDSPPAIIYGSYAGEAHKPAKPDTPAEHATQGTVDEWESEGGAIEGPTEPILPAGVTTKLVREYRVGAFVYQDLGLALAEHLRQMSAEGDDDDALGPAKP